MKYIYIRIFVLIITSGVLFVSCKKDFLERVAQNSIADENFWKTQTDLEKGVIGVYNQLAGESATIYMDAASDNAYNHYQWESTAKTMTSGDITSESNGGWGFEDIRRANKFLENYARATQVADGVKKRMQAEVRFLRAWFYWDKVVKFGNYPLITKTLEIEEINVPRTGRDSVVAFILSELDAIVTDLPQHTQVSKGRVTKGAALALKSRILLTEASPYFNSSNNIAKWESAANAAKAVMSLGYSLYKLADESGVNLSDDYSKIVDFENTTDETKFRLGLRSYQTLFEYSGENNNEAIFQRNYMNQKDINYLNTYLPPAELGGWSSVVPTQELINTYLNYKTAESVAPPTNSQRAEWYNKKSPEFLLEYKNRDPRMYATIMFDGNPWNNIKLNNKYTFYWIGAGGNNNSYTGYNFRKMIDPVSMREQVANYTNVILMRYAEILLNYAEAQNEWKGPEASVYDALDQIRDRVGMPLINRTKYNTKEKLRDAIKNERRVELALEGQRYLDIRRWKMAPQVMKPIYSVNNLLVQNRVWSDKLYYYPVPQSQMDLSKGILKQNEGY